MMDIQNPLDAHRTFVIEAVSATLHHMGRCTEHHAALLYGMALGAVDSLVFGKHLDEEGAEWLRTDLRRALDGHHPNGHARFVELVEGHWPDLAP